MPITGLKSACERESILRTDHRSRTLWDAGKDKRRFSLNTMLEHVHAVLSTTPERWQRLVSTLPIDLLTRPPGASEWSALHCLQHLLDAERLNFPVRFHAFLAGQDFAAFDPSRADPDLDALTPEQIHAAFALSRHDSLVMLNHLGHEATR